MLTLNLLKKDFLLSKSKIGICFLIVIAIPIFLNRITVNTGILEFYTFYMTVTFCEIFICSDVFIAEDKYKGEAYLSATPFTRKMLVVAKYLLVLSIFLSCCMIYGAISQIEMLGVPKLSLFSYGMSFLTTAVVYGIFIPLYYRFGYTKIKELMMVISIMLPAWGIPLGYKLLQYSGINFKIDTSLFNHMQNLLIYVAAIIIGFMSVKISLLIFLKKDF